MPAVLVATTDRGSVRYHPLVLALAAASGGMVIDRVWQPPLWFFWFAAPLALGGWLTLWLCRRDRVASGVLLLAAAAVAAGWHHCAWHLFGRDEIGLFAGTQAQPVALRARVCRAPRRIPSPPKSPLQVFGDDERWRLELAVSALRDRDCWRNASGRVLLTVTGPMSALRAGDQVQVFAQMETPPAAANPGEFEYARFLRGDRVLALLSTEAGACVERLADGTRLSLARTLEGARRRANDLLGRLLNPHNARLAAVLLLGEREEFEAERSDAFLRTGTIHLLSISGLHVGILAIFATQLLRRLPIPAGWSMAAVAALIVAYMLLVDARAPVVRATVLVVAAALGVAIGRPRLSLNLLAGAALVVLAWNPTDLFRVGPQLSFLAAAVLMWFGPRLVQREVTSDPLARFVDHYRSAWEKACRRQLWAARQVTLLGAVVWSITLPLVLARFHVFSPAALVLNTILWIPVGVALTFGFMAVGLSAIWLPLGMPCGWVCDLSLWIIEAVVDRTASLPGSHGWLPGPADWWLFGFYGGLAAVLAVPRLPLPLRWRVAILAVWVGCGFAISGLARPQDELRCMFLSVGHGCAVLLETPGGRTILYDAGRLGAPHRAAESISAALWSRGTMHIDAIVLSHADTDHFNAMPELLERFSVGAVYVSPVMFEEEAPALGVLTEAISRSGVPLAEIRAGDRLRTDDNCRIEVLHPPQRGVIGRDNANSLVLLVEYRGHTILLPGDLEPPGLSDLLAEEPVFCEILLVPHHGSSASNPVGLFDWARPRQVVISGDRRSDTSGLEALCGRAGATLWHTADCGAVTFRICGGSLKAAESVRVAPLQNLGKVVN